MGNTNHKTVILGCHLQQPLPKCLETPLSPGCGDQVLAPCVCLGPPLLHCGFLEGSPSQPFPAPCQVSVCTQPGHCLLGCILWTRAWNPASWFCIYHYLHMTGAWYSSALGHSFFSFRTSKLDWLSPDQGTPGLCQSLHLLRPGVDNPDSALVTCPGNVSGFPYFFP